MGVGLSQACLKKQKEATLFDRQRVKRREVRPGRVIQFVFYVCFVFVLSAKYPNPGFSYKYQKDLYPVCTLAINGYHYLSSGK